MADASETLINGLQARVNDLTNELARANAEAMKRRKESKPLREQLDALTRERDGLIKERDSWKGKAEAAPSELLTRVEKAEAALTERDHRDAWHDAIGGDLADKATVAKVWSEIEYKPGADIPAPEQIKEQARAARDRAPYLFKPADATSADAPGGAQNGARPRLSTSPAGAGRGAPDTASRRFTVTKSQTRDPRWMRENQSRIEAARVDGTLHLIEG